LSVIKMKMFEFAIEEEEEEDCEDCDCDDCEEEE
jgi:hypothetical protein